MFLKYIAKDTGKEFNAEWPNAVILDKIDASSYESMLADYIPNVKCIWSTRKSMTKYDKETDTMTITEFDEHRIISNLAEYEKLGKIKPVS